MQPTWTAWPRQSTSSLQTRVAGCPCPPSVSGSASRCPSSAPPGAELCAPDSQTAQPLPVKATLKLFTCSATLFSLDIIWGFKTSAF